MPQMLLKEPDVVRLAEGMGKAELVRLREALGKGRMRSAG
jgi:hypothetical protein